MAAPNPFMAAPNRFMAPDPIPANAVSDPHSANPFLAESPAHEPTASPAPQVVAHKQGAPLAAKPGASSPSVRNPHAEFRKGGWKKPAIAAAAAAAIATGLFFGLPETGEEKAAGLSGEQHVPAAVIGASMSPEIIQDPDRRSLTNPSPPAARVHRDPEESAVSSDRSDRSEGFAASFKASSAH